MSERPWQSEGDVMAFQSPPISSGFPEIKIGSKVAEMSGLSFAEFEP